MSFRRFSGLKISGRVTDRYTIWGFRKLLVQANVEHQIFSEVQRQLQQHGLQIREAQIIGTSIVRRPSSTTWPICRLWSKEQAVWGEWSPAKRRQNDVDARWTNKRGKSYVGTSSLSARVAGTS
ncbi:hypothetical protein [Geopseudomonas aromaticivorans]